MFNQNRKALHRLPLLLVISSLVMGLSAQIGAQAAPSAAPAAVPAGFAYRCGIHFCLDGNTFYFAGANTYDIFTYGGAFGDTETQFMDKAKIDAQFARLQADKVTVLRLWMFSHESWHGFEKTKGVYDEQQFALFDYIIQSAKAHNVKLMPVFENYWEAYGGIDTRLSWEGVSGGHPGRWRFFNPTICPGCRTSYKNYINYALNRVNHYSGIAYKNEPAIFAWDLMNEPRYQDATPNENTTGTTLRAWVDEMAAYVKSIDPNHMVGVGLEAHESRFGFGGDEGNPFIYIHQSPYIDMTSAHPYPTESWANLSMAQTRALVRQWIQESHNIVGKPFYLGEFNTHTGDRSQWWTEIFGEMEVSDGDGSGFWWYQATSVDGKFGVSQGAPELAVFRAHSNNMAARNGPPPPTATPCTGCPTNTPTRTNTPIPTITPTPSKTSTPIPFTNFVKGININGNAVTIEGNPWISYATALSTGFSQSGGAQDTKSLTPIPATDPDTTSMLNSLLYSSGNLLLSQTISNGNYQVYVWTMENYSTNVRNWNLRVEGVTVATGLGLLPLNGWAKYGPYSATVSDGVLNVDLLMVQAQPMIMGLAIYSNGPTATPGGPTNTPTNTLVPPTNTPTATNTSVPPTNTPTRTNTPTGPTNTPTNTLPPTNTPTRTNTPNGPTNTPTNTSVSPTNTPTNTTVPPTNTPTNTPSGPTPTSSANFHVEAAIGSITNQETQYKVKLFNDSASSQANLKVRVFMNLTEVYNAGLTFSDVVAEEFWDQCGSVSYSAATVWNAAQKTYYVDLPFGNTFTANSVCEVHWRIRLSAWQTVWDGTNDYSYSGLTSAYSVTQKMPVYQNNVRVYGTEPP
jgi:hypothetical protein